MKAEKVRSTLRLLNELDHAVNLKRCFDELEELERIATEYEANKHYIELGKAVEKAFNKNCDIYLYEENESVNGYLLGYGVEVAERITKPEQLLKWAEGRAND